MIMERPAISPGLLCTQGAARRFIKDPNNVIVPRAARTAVLTGLLLSSLSPLAAQSSISARQATVVGTLPTPELPETAARDANGHATVRAVALPGRIAIDGRLDEPFYTALHPMSGFLQAEPLNGTPAEEQTEIWIFFDKTTLYIAARCHESHPERLVANELRRDHNNIIQNDNIAFGFDTYLDRRSGLVFETSPIGAKLDVQYAYAGQNNYDWNPLWTVKVQRDDTGWSVEAAVPFKSIRYGNDSEPIWGFNVRRSSRWRNEVSYLNPVPLGIGMGGIFRSEMSAPLLGLKLPPSPRLVEIKPYVVGDLVSDHTVTPAVSNDPSGDYGLDVKYGITSNITADLTYKTDFAQVEADNQQVNLTRFSLFFPEKRDFFLENQGLFNFGGGFAGGDTPTMFYSRRIGLGNGRPVPIVGGGRVTGRTGRLSFGAISIRADDEPVTRTAPTTFSVLRLKRDVLRRSTIGLIATDRTVSLDGKGRSATLGTDARLAFFDNLLVNAFWARTDSPGPTGRDSSSRVQLDYTADRYGVQLEQLNVGARFNPEVGFVRRVDMERSYGAFRFSPRLQHPIVRKVPMSASLTYITNGSRRLETRAATAEFGIDFQNSDHFEVGYSANYEFLPRPFVIARGVVLPVGGYDFQSARAQYGFGRQRTVSGTVSYEAGSFYNGTKQQWTVGGARLNLGPRFSTEPTASVNHVTLTEGAFTATLIGSRVTFTMTPMMFASTLVQYNVAARSVSVNARLRWEYILGSELFVVYTEQRDTAGAGFQNRSFVVKINRMFRL